ncbi:hypothetical protein P3T18_002559 [Paraburkholderia sp. GAS199]|uniref:hypothetical protein n=1 Tax=Paraburkholderia sp. GAS199 TaxID=3035126 RepID=UPI003D233E20
MLPAPTPAAPEVDPLAPPLPPFAPEPVDELPSPAALCEPRPDEVPNPAAAATPNPIAVGAVTSSCLQPRVSYDGQSTGNACASMKLVEFPDGAAVIPTFVSAPAIAA